MGLKVVGRDLRVGSVGLQPAEIARRLAKASREAVAEAIRTGEGTERRTTIVNGRSGASEDSVVPPGPIVVRFHWWREIALYALEFARARSPVDSGAYRDAWFLLADGKPVEADAIPAGIEALILTNDRPYHRKIDVGAMKGMRVPAHVTEDTRQALQRQFKGLVRAETSFIEIAGGYVLKGPRRRVRTRRGDVTGRWESRRGEVLTYPAVEISLR